MAAGFMAAGCGEDGPSTPRPSPDQPAITAFAPLDGSAGDSIVIQGTAFDDSTGSPAAVAFGDATALAAVNSAGELRLVIPPGADTAPIRVTNAGGTATSSLYLIVYSGELPAAMISSLSPGSGGEGTAVTIMGTGFDPVPLANHVTFNDVPAVIDSASATTIIATVPAGAATGPVAVATTRGRAVADATFLVGEGIGDCTNPSSVSGTISAPAHWTLAGCPYIVHGELTVTPAARLTIDAGVVVKFDGVGAGMRVDGELITDGDAVNRVVFTSYLDDARVGDTNGDGISTSPARGDWAGIRISPGGRADLAGTDLWYAGATGEGGMQLSTRAHIDDCSFAFNLGYGLAAPAPPAHPDSLVVTNCTFHGNERPLLVNPGVNLGDSNAFSSGAIGNDENAIFLSTLPSTAGSSSWTETDVPFAAIEMPHASTVFLGAGHELTIGPGVVVKLLGTDMGIAVYGTLVTAGTPGNEVVITSYRNDTLLGDTNGDGGATVAARGDWDTLELGRGSRTTLRHTRIEFGGSLDWRRSEAAALSIMGGAWADIEDCRIGWSYKNGISLFGGSGRISSCSIENNRIYGVRCASGATWYLWGGEELDAPFNDFAANDSGNIRIITP